MTPSEMADTLSKAYTEVFGKFVNPKPRIVDLDDREGQPTRGVEFLDHIIYETTSPEGTKYAVDEGLVIYNPDSGPEGELVEVGLYDHFDALVAEVLALIAKAKAEAWLESQRNA